MSVRDTSLEVFNNEVAGSMGQKQLAVYRVLGKSKRPVCNQEVADHMGQPINTITPRMNELVSKGAVELAFKGVYPKTNRRVCYWRLTPHVAS